MAETLLPWTLKLADVCPAATVTVAGSFAADELLLRATVTPPGGAGWFSEIVPVVTIPGPIIAYGINVKVVDSTGPGSTDNVPVRARPLKLAVIVTVTGPATGPAIPVNVPVVDPKGIVMEAGTAATAGVSLVRVTVAPPSSAPALSVTVPVKGCPLDTNGILTLANTGCGTAATDTGALTETPLAVAVTMPLVSAGAPSVEKKKVAPLAPGLIVRDEGITIAGFVLVKVTVMGTSVGTVSPTPKRFPEL